MSSNRTTPKKGAVSGPARKNAQSGSKSAAGVNPQFRYQPKPQTKSEFLMKSIHQVFQDFPDVKQSIITLERDGTIVTKFKKLGDTESVVTRDELYEKRAKEDPVVAGNLRKSAIEHRIKQRLGDGLEWKSLTDDQKKLVMKSNKTFRAENASETEREETQKGSPPSAQSGTADEPKEA